MRRTERSLPSACSLPEGVDRGQATGAPSRAMRCCETPETLGSSTLETIPGQFAPRAGLTLSLARGANYVNKAETKR